MSILRVEGALDLGSIAEISPDLILLRIEEALRSMQVHSIRRGDRSLTFRVGWTRLVPSWDALAPIDSGEIQLDGEPVQELRYRLSLVRVFVLSLLLTAVLGSLLIWVQPVWAIAVFMIPVWWAWVFGGSYLMARTRVPEFIRKAAGSVGT